MAGAKSKPKLSKAQKDKLVKEFGHMPTQEEVFNKIKASQQKMMWALAKAWDAAPDDPKVRKQLIDVIEKAAKFDKKLQELIDKSKSDQK